MAVRNGGRYLCQAVESVLYQTLPDFEFVVIDDGSTDGTPDILSYYEGQDSRLRIYRQENQGLTLSLNRALDLAQGKYVARLDADDVSLPHRFSTQMGFLESHPGVGVVGSWAQYVDGTGKPLAVWQNPAEHGSMRWRLCFNNVLAHSSVMMRLDAVNAVGGYDPKLRYSQDYDLWCRLSDVVRLSSIQQVLVHFRRHSAKVSHQHRDEQRVSSLRTSQRVISAVLGVEVPVKSVESLRNERCCNVGGVVRCSGYLYALYRAFVRGNPLGISERRWVRQDAARMLWKVARPRARDVRTWRPIWRACWLDPSLGVSALASPLRRVAARLQALDVKA